MKSRHNSGSSALSAYAEVRNNSQRLRRIPTSRNRHIVTSHVLLYCVKISGITQVGKHRAAARCRSVKKLLPCHAEPRSNSFKSSWNDWDKNTLLVLLNTILSTGRIISTGRSILMQQSKTRSPNEPVPCWVTSCNKFACDKHLLFYWEPTSK